jgi:predicted AAA+ superfamily ATPase
MFDAHKVHRLIEQRGIRFIMTGSSARKLRRGGVNLLGGRAREGHLHPRTWYELGDAFDLQTAVSRGTLPSIYFSDDPNADLSAYAGLYLQQEVLAEGATRNVPAFSRVLRVAALCNATLVNFTNVANDAQVPRTTVYEYFGILRDTLVLTELPSWRESRKRRPIVSSKYCFFDIGVAGSLQGRSAVRPGTSEFSAAVETFVMQEPVAWRDYRSGDPLSYWRSASGFEVYCLIGDHTAIELKASAHISPQDLRSLRALDDEQVFKRLICVSLETRTRKVGNITILPLARFFEQLWDGAFT